MPSHLNRLVIRRILLNEPIISRTCVRQRPGFSALQGNYNGFRHNGFNQRRTLFGFGGWGKKKKGRQSNTGMTPGMDKMLELNDMLVQKSRPPAPEELVEALYKIFEAKAASKKPLEDLEFTCVLQAIRHLNSLNVSKDSTNWLSSELLQKAMVALQSVPKNRPSQYLALARDSVRVLEERSYLKIDWESASALLVRMLAAFDEASEARELLVEQGIKKGRAEDRDPTSWIAILDSYARQGNAQEVSHTVRMMQELKVPLNSAVRSSVISAFAAVDNVPEVKHWYDETISMEGSEITPDATKAALECCLRKKEHAWGQSIIKLVLTQKKVITKGDWDLVFLWALGLGKGVDEVERMMQVMVRRTAKTDPVRPDVETINMLVRFSHSRRDPYTAERLVTLGEKWGIQPNATTYTLQMDYRLSINDIDGAKAAWGDLRKVELTGSEDGPVTNRLIQAMINSGNYNFDTTMTVVDDLNARKAPFEAHTVAALCKLHLFRDELHDAIDLLQTQIHEYSFAEREVVIDMFLSVSKDPKTTDALAWDAFTICTRIFPEVTLSQREDMMDEFFRRDRPDLAIHIFQEIRKKVQPHEKATNETYVKAFLGIADCADEESFNTIYNLVKISVDVEPNTRLWNAAMIACIGCDMAQRAIMFWREIYNSNEGPDLNSILIVFRACEEAPLGWRTAKPLWERIRSMDIDITREMFASYVGAMGGNALAEEAIELIEGEGKKDLGFQPDLLILGTLYNSSHKFMFKQDEIETWMKSKYSNIWNQLEKAGIQEDEETGWKVFKLDRGLKP